MATQQDDLHWRVEEACCNAWPCARQLLAAPWLLRMHGGAVRRVNSVNPLRAEHYDVAAMLASATALYVHNGQPLIVRVPTLSLTASIDAALDQRDFSREGETCTLLAEQLSAGRTDSSVVLSPTANADWRAARQSIQQQSTSQHQSCLAAIDTIIAPAMFAALCDDGDRIAAIAFGIIHTDLLVLESVATEATLRRRGYARRVVAALLHWAASAGAERACLQVQADNPAALALYASLGFDHELYRYHYRRPPPSQG